VDGAFLDDADYLTEQLEILIENLGDYLDALKPATR
jgi:hypothetical protein